MEKSSSSVKPAELAQALCQSQIIEEGVKQEHFLTCFSKKANWIPIIN